MVTTTLQDQSQSDPVCNFRASCFWLSGGWSPPQPRPLLIASTRSSRSTRERRFGGSVIVIIQDGKHFCTVHCPILRGTGPKGVRAHLVHRVLHEYWALFIHGRPQKNKLMQSLHDWNEDDVLYDN